MTDVPPPPADRARDAWLQELWPVCRELPWGDRQAKLADDRRQQRHLEDAQAEADTEAAHFRAAS